MKKPNLKKWSSLILSVCLLSSAASSLTSCQAEMEKYVDFVVNVPQNRDARILHISDPQLTDTENAEEYCYRYVRQVTERFDPDLILVTGDVVYGKFDEDGSCLTSYIEFMETLDTPWAPVFGNHDNESVMGVDWQCEQFEKAENCLFKQRELSGNGNYSVGIRQGSKLQRVFYMLDTNGCYDVSEQSKANGHTVMTTGVQYDQKEWCLESIRTLQTKYPDTKLSIAFHIQPYAFSLALYKYYFHNVGVDLDTYEKTQVGDFGYYGAGMKSPWDTSRSTVGDFTEAGVDSFFVGHEHLNSWSIVMGGVRYQYGQKCSQYDRYNKWIDGEIVGDYSHNGTPILGGTKIVLDKENGEIKSDDCGLILYDESL